MALFDLLPLHSQQQCQSGRDKRSWFPFLGGTLKPIVGTSTYEDLKVVDEHVKTLAAIAKGEFNEMKTFSEYMSSYMETNNRRSDNLVAALKEQQTVAVHYSHDVEHTVESHIHTLSALIADVVKTSNTLSMLEVQYGNLLSSVETLVCGSIPTFLLPLNVLGNTLSSIQSIRDRDFRRCHHMHTDPS